MEPHMPVQLICPNLKCRKFLQVPDEVRGKLVKCQSCGGMLRVPGADTARPKNTAGVSK
jgi:hypothetical protein